MEQTAKQATPSKPATRKKKPAPKPCALAPKQAAFLDEYMIDLNGTQAAIRAGYSKKTARVTASKLLSKANIASEIARRRKELSEKTAVTAENVIKEMAKIAFANMQDYIRISSNGEPYIDLSSLTRDQAAALSETCVEDFTEGRGDEARDVRRVKIKFHSKDTALIQLGKHLGIFPDRHELTGKNGKPIEHRVTARIVRGGAPR